ncbi:hypothetical protein KEM52_003901 [Ascosphaera acerosa]|nr:hypothetical protein KEM52_003901 [Ascosphaera acerosa]
MLLRMTNPPYPPKDKVPEKLLCDCKGDCPCCGGCVCKDGEKNMAIYPRHYLDEIGTLRTQRNILAGITALGIMGWAFSRVPG